MKKFIIFTVYAVVMCAVFLNTVFRGSMVEFKLWVGHIYYLLIAIAVLFVVLVIGIYHQYKKLKLQSPHQRQQAIQQLRQNALNAKETKMILLMSGLYLIFCGGIVFFMDFSNHSFILFITGISITYMGLMVLLFWAYRRNSQWKLKQALQQQESLNLKMRS